jgi:hypothetical protein
MNHKLSHDTRPKMLHDSLPTTSPDLEREEDAEGSGAEDEEDAMLTHEPASVKLYVGITAFLLLGSFLIAVNVERLETVGHLASIIFLQTILSIRTAKEQG